MGKYKSNGFFGRWAQLETFLHEQVHLWQQNFGNDPVKPGKPYHNKEFVEKYERFGLHPKLGPGCHTKPADGVFAILMEELVLEKPDMPKLMKELSKDWFIAWLESQGKKKKGKSSLKKWTCPVCGLNARMGIKDNPLIRHDPCKKKTGHEVFFVHDDGLKHTIICRKGFRK